MAAKAKINENHTQTSSMGGKGGIAIGYPWSKCTVGCRAKEDTEVILLKCMHVICSDKCLAKLRSEVKPGEPLICRMCNTEIARQDLGKKIVPQKQFAKKTAPKEPTVICDNCILGRPAVCYCPQCPASLCQTCRDLHPQFRATQSHELKDDLTEQKALQMTKEQELSTKCKIHEAKLLTNVCIDCQQKICEECVVQHQQHTVVDIEKETKMLTAKLDMARYVASRSTLAIAEMKKKREEILSNGWDNVMSDIDDQFAMMMSVLMTRHKEVQREAKMKFLKQLEDLRSKAHNAQLVKCCSEEFVKAIENGMSEMDDIANINLLRHSQGYLQFVAEMEKLLRVDFDRFVEKGWHFQVDSSANIQARNYLQRYCEVEYSYQPRIPKVTLKTYAGAKTVVKPVNNHKAASPAEKADNSGSDNTNRAEQVPLQRCGFAVKSTSNGTTTPRTYGRKDVSVVPRAATPGVNDHDAHQKESKQAIPPSQIRTRRSSFKVSTAISGDEGVAEDMIIDSPTPGESSEASSSTSTIAGTKEDEEDLTSDSKKASKSPLKPSRLFQDKSKTDSEATGSVSKNKMDKTKEMPKNLTEPLSSPDDDDFSLRNSEASTASCSPSPSSETSGRELGKRERKKKSLPPGFVGTDQGLKQHQKREAAEAAAAAATTRLRRKSTSSNSGAGPSTNTKMPRLQPESADNDGKVKATLEFDNANIDEEDESGDDDSNEPGPATRRQSLRMRGTQKEAGQQKKELNVEPSLNPTEAELANRRGGRGKARKMEQNDNDEVSTTASAFPVAPSASLEEPPEFCDYPVQGQGVMKIKNDDDNDDYCCICLDGGEIIVCCDYCPKVFHLSCHIPILNAVPEGDENDKWRCNYDTTKEMIDEMIQKFPEEEGSESKELVVTNKRHFVVACKFVMECYKIDEIPTMRWKFPTGYLAKFGKVPYHLKYIRERLCTGVPGHFASVQDMLAAFKQMFQQAFLYYKEDNKILTHARTCFEKFLSLIEEYYPDYRHLFNNMEPTPAKHSA